MSSIAQVVVHASQFPEAVRRDLIESLRTRRVNHKFHYDSVKQAQKWLALHEAHSPARRDADCRDAYEQAFAAAAAEAGGSKIRVIGLGCGGGQKDVQLLKLLLARNRTISYTPCDVSLALTLVARQAATAVVPENQCFPFVCDLATARDLPEVLEQIGPPDTARLVTFFGMIPNFEPGEIVPKLAGLLRANDLLLFSANLAPGADYAAGVRQILPQYDNELTREWLLTFLLDLGVERGDGELIFRIEDVGGEVPLKRVVADFRFGKARSIKVDGETFEFRVGEVVRLFFSYRYTPALVRGLLEKHGLRVRGEFLAGSGEEGVFLVGR